MVEDMPPIPTLHKKQFLFILIFLIFFILVMPLSLKLKKYGQENRSLEIQKSQLSNISFPIEDIESDKIKKCYNLTPQIQHRKALQWLDPKTINLSCTITSLEEQEINLSLHIKLYIEKEKLLDVIADKDAIFLPPPLIIFPKRNLSLKPYETVSYYETFMIVDPRLYDTFECYIEVKPFQRCL